MPWGPLRKRAPSAKRTHKVYVCKNSKLPKKNHNVNQKYHFVKITGPLGPFQKMKFLGVGPPGPQGGSPQDGVYGFTGMPVLVLCDFSHDGGGWTLLMTARSRDGWNLLSVRSCRERSPSLDDNYSILRHADAVRDLGKSD